MLAQSRGCLPNCFSRVGRVVDAGKLGRGVVGVGGALCLVQIGLGDVGTGDGRCGMFRSND